MKSFNSMIALGAVATIFAGAVNAVAHSSNPLVDAVRAANDRFQDVSVAIAEGYSPIPCTSGTDGGAMGIHYVNPDIIADESIDIAKPEAVMYSADGQATLLAVEYITPKGPAELQGHLFSYTSEPNRYGLPAFYELHVWAWMENPKGAFADMNPNVSCDGVPSPE